MSWLRASSLAALIFTSAAAIAQECAIRVTIDATTTAFGAPFTVQVERRWRHDLVPSPWSDAALAPFVVLEATWSKAAGHDEVRETGTLRLAAFEVGERELPAVAFVAATADGAEEWIASSAARRLTITTSLADPESEPERPELPATVATSPTTWFVSGGVGVLVVAVALLALARRGRTTAPSAEARRAIHALRARGAGVRESALALSHAVRACLGDSALARTTSELRKSADPELLDLLDACERAVYSTSRPRSPDDLLARAERVLARTEGPA